MRSVIAMMMTGMTDPAENVDITTETKTTKNVGNVVTAERMRPRKRGRSVIAAAEKGMGGIESVMRVVTEEGLGIDQEKVIVHIVLGTFRPSER